MNYDFSPQFRAGRLVATPGALAVLEEARMMPNDLLRRHVTCDWGEVCEEDARANDLALERSLRILSVYRVNEHSKIWIITEADRSATTLLLPEEY